MTICTNSLAVMEQFFFLVIAYGWASQYCRLDDRFLDNYFILFIAWNVRELREFLSPNRNNTKHDTLESMTHNIKHTTFVVACACACTLFITCAHLLTNDAVTVSFADGLSPFARFAMASHTCVRTNPFAMPCGRADRERNGRGHIYKSLKAT